MLQLFSIVPYFFAGSRLNDIQTYIIILYSSLQTVRCQQMTLVPHCKICGDFMLVCNACFCCEFERMVHILNFAAVQLQLCCNQGFSFSCVAIRASSL